MQFRLTSLIVLLSLLGVVRLSAQCELPCKSSQEIILPNNGQYFLGFGDVLDSLPADCPSLDSLEIIPNLLTCAFAGAATPYEIRNVNTGERLCGGVIEVKDTTEPEIICRDVVTINLTGSRTSRNMIQQDYVFAVFDNCDRRGNFNFFPRVVDCGDVGNTLEYYVTDLENGQDTVCTGTVQVIDPTPPVVECVDTLTIDLPANGSPRFIFPSSLIREYVDNCSSINNINIFPAILDCGQIGDNPYVVSSRATGDTLCTGIISVLGGSAPQVNCIDTAQFYLPQDGSGLGISASDLVTSFQDNCGSADQLILSPVDTLDCSVANSLLDYELFAPGVDAAVCSGVLEVLDTFSTNVECQPSVIVSLPLTYSGFNLSPDIFLKESTFTCGSIENLEASPSAVFCFNAGETIPYFITYTGTGDTLCTGTLTVENSSETVISCLDTVRVTLPSSGRAYQLDWRDVVESFSDNCLTLFDLTVDPGLLGCEDAGRFVDFSVRTIDNNTELCTGVVEVIDDTPLSVTCKDVVSVSIASNGFPAMLFASRVVESISDNCSSQTDFTVFPTFYFCPDSSATYSLRSRSTREELCTGTVIVTGNPSPFGNCAPANAGGESFSANQLGFNVPQENRTMQVFPNPTNLGNIRMVLPENQEIGSVQYRILNLLGQQQSFGRFDYQYGGVDIPLTNLDAGTYLLIAELADGSRYTKRFVKTNSF